MNFPLRPHIAKFGETIRLTTSAGRTFEIDAIIDRAQIDVGEIETQQITILIHNDDIKNRDVEERDQVTLFDIEEEGETFLIRDIHKDDLPAVNMLLSFA